MDRVIDIGSNDGMLLSYFKFEFTGINMLFYATFVLTVISGLHYLARGMRIFGDVGEE